LAEAAQVNLPPEHGVEEVAAVVVSVLTLLLP